MLVPAVSGAASAHRRGVEPIFEGAALSRGCQQISASILAESGTDAYRMPWQKRPDASRLRALTLVRSEKQKEPPAFRRNGSN